MKHFTKDIKFMRKLCIKWRFIIDVAVLSITFQNVWFRNDKSMKCLLTKLFTIDNVSEEIIFPTYSTHWRMFTVMLFLVNNWDIIKIYLLYYTQFFGVILILLVFGVYFRNNCMVPKKISYIVFSRLKLRPTQWKFTSSE